MTNAESTESTGSSSLPLSGVRVLDATQALSGPYGTMLLADLGADIVKLERPGVGDDARHWGPPFVGASATYFVSVNRNKRSVALDLRDPNGQAGFMRLLASADVFVQNWRPGVAEALEADYESLSKKFRDLIYCAISGFGADGPRLSGYDHVIQGFAGLMTLNGEPDAVPTKLGVPLGDLAAGMFAAQAIMAGLIGRQSSGLGSYIDISMHDCLLSLLTYQSARYLATNVNPLRTGNMHPSIVPYGTFETADGLVNICIGSDEQWRRLCVALDGQDLISDPRFRTNPERCLHRVELHTWLEPRLRQCHTAGLLDQLRHAQVPAGPIRTVEEALESAVTRERGLRIPFTDRDGFSGEVVGGPWKIDGEPVRLRIPPPVLGEHNDELLGGLFAQD